MRHKPIRRHEQRRWRRVLPLAAALALTATACGAGGDDSDAAATDAFGAEESAVEATVVESAPVGGSDDAGDGGFALEADESIESAGESDTAVEGVLGTGGAPTGSLADATSQTDPADTGRDIIRTAEIQADVESVAEASSLAITRIEGLGGLLFGQETTTDGTPRSTLVFKVQPADFSEALERLSDLGFLRDQRISADDVTDRVVDLESRIITAEASVERLRGFLENATDLADIASLEGQLLERETSLELLRGQLRTVQNQVDLATITVTFVEIVPGPALELVATAYAGHDDGSTCDGDERLDVDEGTALTLCFRITNSGDTFLNEIEVRDDRFDLEMDDLLLHSGDLDEPLAPGESIVLYGEIVAEESASGRAQANATPVDDDGADLRLGNVGARSELFVDVDPDTSVPSFGEGFGAGWGALVTFIQVIVLAVGTLLPWMWVPVGLWFLIRWNRKRLASRPQPVMPPPPVAPAAPVHPGEQADEGTDEPNVTGDTI